MEQGALESLGADEQVVPQSEAKQLQARVRQLERLARNLDDSLTESPNFGEHFRPRRTRFECAVLLD
jgi:hypothetical protein